MFQVQISPGHRMFVKFGKALRSYCRGRPKSVATKMAETKYSLWKFDINITYYLVTLPIFFIFPRGKTVHVCFWKIWLLSISHQQYIFSCFYEIPGVEWVTFVAGEDHCLTLGTRIESNFNTKFWTECENLEWFLFYQHLQDKCPGQWRGKS